MPTNVLEASVLGEDAVFSGRIVGKDFVILGRFEGSVEISGVLRIGNRGYARCQVRSSQVSVEGTFEGEISAGLLFLAETARAQGLFKVGRLRMQEGAILNGSVSPQGSVSPSPVRPAVQKSPTRTSTSLDDPVLQDEVERWEDEGGPTPRLK